jgi:hypothetical protein
MRSKRLIAVLGISLAVGVAISAGTCVIPRDVWRTYAAYAQDPSTENHARYKQAVERGAFAEHVTVAVIAAAAAAAALLGAPKLWRFWLWMGEG